MARPKLRTAQQPLWVQAILGLYEFFASLKLAVLLIFSAAIVLGWATFVESKYGLRAVHYGIYGTWWFTAINALLALNIFCAAAIRYPWKRHQTGFVITHIGLLLLLFGCFLSRRGGIDAQMGVFVGGDGHRAVEDSQHFRLTVAPTNAKQVEEITIPFESGPFNWEDYDRKHWLPIKRTKDQSGTNFAAHDGLFWFPWALPGRDAGVVYDEDGIRLEVLDYYSDCREIDAPMVKLQLSSPRMTQQNAQGQQELGRESWIPVELKVRKPAGAFAALRPGGVGQSQSMGGGQVGFWMATSRAETQAFLNNQPDGPLGKQGRVVLHAQGKKVSFLVEEKLGQPRFALEGTPLEAEVSRYMQTAILNDKSSRTLDELDLIEMPGAESPESPAVEITIYNGDADPEKLLLVADMPYLDRQGYRNQVFGSYWFDHGEKTAAELMQGEGGSRIDIVQGQRKDGKPGLFYRYWNRKEVAIAKELPTDGTKVNAFKMPIAQLRMYVDEFIPSEQPDIVLRPKPFSKDQTAPDAVRAAKVRLTVDKKAEEFWLLGPPNDPLHRPLPAIAKREIEGEGRAVALTMPLDEVDIGFRVKLREFERKLDPGTDQASHFTSWVDFLHPERDKSLAENVMITMNAPVDFSGPGTKEAPSRSYRIFQEAFRGPFRPGDGIYEAWFKNDSASGPEQLYMSVLTVNYNPGRGFQYTGCLLIVAGIAIMFFMRAYFFKLKARV